MREPSPRTSRLAIAGGLAVAIAVGAAGFFLGRSTAPKPKPVVMVPPPVLPRLPDVEPQRTLSRADIIALANSAADALTSGRVLPDKVTGVAGRRFELAIPFGCDGPAPETSGTPLRWSYDSEEQTLRIHAFPTRWTEGDWQLGDATDHDKQFEGFWISRPWSSAEQCPKRAGQAAARDVQPITLPGQTLAVAEAVPTDPRRDAQAGQRRFEIVQRMAVERFDGSQGFRLRLIGRIEKSVGGRVVQCVQPAGIEQRPACLVGVTFDEVRIESPADDKILATWRSGSVQRSAQ